jgi:hypothetical protein
VYTPGAGDASPDASAVLTAIRAGHVFGTSGPMLFLRSGDAMPGDTVRTADATVAFTVRVLAAPWIDVDEVEIYRDGQRIAGYPVTQSTRQVRLERTFTVPVGTNPRSFVVAIARGDQTLDVVLPTLSARPFAFTNPIWIERTAAPPRPPTP